MLVYTINFCKLFVIIDRFYILDRMTYTVYRSGVGRQLNNLNTIVYFVFLGG